jgi:hypothetical protein
MEMAISRNIRIVIVLSAIWIVIDLIICINDAHDVYYGYYSYWDFFKFFAISGILPLIITWGIIWIRSSPKKQPSEKDAI